MGRREILDFHHDCLDEILQEYDYKTREFCHDFLIFSIRLIEETHLIFPHFINFSFENMVKENPEGEGLYIAMFEILSKFKEKINEMENR